MRLYLPVDNETGGLGDDVGLLSTHLEVVDIFKWRLLLMVMLMRLNMTLR